MIHYLLLAIITVVIVVLSIKIWKITRNVSFPIGFFILYYWTFLGSWFFIGDSLSGWHWKKIGLHYHYLFEKMFPVMADSDYLIAMSYYGIFFIIIQLTVLFFISKNKNSEISNQFSYPRLEINNWVIFLISIISTVVSFYIMRNEIIYAINNNLSIYTITRASDNVFYSIHRLLNVMALSPLLFCFLIFISGDNVAYLKSYQKKRKLILPIYLLLILIVEMYIIMLGNKHEFLNCLIISIVLYSFNMRNKFNLKHLILFMFIIGVPLFFINDIRALPINNLFKNFGNKLTFVDKQKQTKPSEQSVEIGHSAISFLFSNEMFAANFSMYGVLNKGIEPSFGKSFISLGASVVPRFIWKDRPEDIYTYYARSVEAKEGQGYTIHHATGWYLNFGVIGIIIGAVILGFIWAKLFNFLNQYPTKQYKNHIIKVFILVALAGFVASLPQVIRAGPEAYKTIIVEGIGVPLLVLSLATYKKRKSTNE